MSGSQNPPPDWGDATDWQRQQQQQPPYGQQQPYGQQPPYGQQQPPGAPPPYMGQQGWQQPPTGPAIQTYLVPAILVTLFCFLPTGIAAIIFASQVNSKRSIGDINGAMQASKQARLWTIISAAVGVVLIIIIIAATAASTSSGSGY